MVGNTVNMCSNTIKLPVVVVGFPKRLPPVPNPVAAGWLAAKPVKFLVRRISRHVTYDT